MESLTAVRRRARKWADYRFLVITVAIISTFAIILTAAVSFIHYGYGGIRDYLSDPLTQSIGGAFLLALLTFGPKLLVLFRPELTSRRWVSMVYDWAWTVGIIFIFSQFWFNLRALPAEVLLPLLAIGLLSAYQGYLVLVKRQSLFLVSLDFLDPSPSPPPGEALLEALNRIMPNEEEQRQLALALLRKYCGPLRSRCSGRRYSCSWGGSSDKF